MVASNLIGKRNAKDEMCPMSARGRLSSRRPGHTKTLQADRLPFDLFLTVGKKGSLVNALLADTAVAISVALQRGVPATALAKSIGRIPAGPVTLADLEGPGSGRVPASRIGAGPGLVTSCENGVAK